MKLIKTVVAAVAVVSVVGCTNVSDRLDKMDAKIDGFGQYAVDASAKADKALAEAQAASTTANDAVEAVSRMAEKCCRK